MEIQYCRWNQDNQTGDLLFHCPNRDCPAKIDSKIGIEKSMTERSDLIDYLKVSYQLTFWL